MGIGPWGMSELMRSVEHTERARFRRALVREEKYLRSLIGSKTAGGIMRGDLEGAFHRMRRSISPKRQRHIRSKKDTTLS